MQRRQESPRPSSISSSRSTSFAQDERTKRRRDKELERWFYITRTELLECVDVIIVQSGFERKLARTQPEEGACKGVLLLQWVLRLCRRFWVVHRQSDRDF